MKSSSPKSGVAAVVAVLAILIGGGAQTAAAVESSQKLADASSVGRASPTSAPIATGGRKVLVIVDENHTQHQVQAGMPYLVRLQKTFGVTTHHTATTHHPSLLDNYLLIAGGSTFGVTGAATPSSHPVAGRSVFGAALARGKTARAYNEMITPNLCNDAHDCSLGTADAFLKAWVPRTNSRRDDLARRYQYAQLFTMVLAVLVELHGEGNLTARRARSGDGARHGQRSAARRLPRRHQGPVREVRRL